MNHDSNLPRRYDDDEVARILKRATEIRRDRALPVPSPQDEGLTLRELEEIAAEAGIDVAHLRQAALEVDVGADRLGPMERFVGGPLTVVQEAVVEGELDEEGFQALLADLQKGLGEFGVPSLMARTLTWKNEPTKNGGRSTMATISSREGRTTLRIEESYQQVAGGLQGGLTAGGGVGLGVGLGVPLAQAVGSVALGVAFPIGALLAAYVIARGSYRGYVNKRGRKIAGVLARLVEVAEREARPSGGPDSRRAQERSLPRRVESGGAGASLEPGGKEGDARGSRADREPDTPDRGPPGSLL